MHLKKIILIFVLSLLSFEPHSFADLGSYLKYYKANPTEHPSNKNIETLRKYHVVFVAGFMNEFEYFTKTLRITSQDLGYFVRNSKILEDLGITVTIRRPTSFETIENSGEVIYLETEGLFKAGGEKPIIYAGHSRGGNAVVSAVLSHPELLREKLVKRVITLQSPVFGNDFPKINAAKVVGRFWLPGESGFLGLRALEPEFVERAIGTEKFLSLAKRDQRLVDNAVLWFTSSKPHEKVSSKPEKILSNIYSPNNVTGDTFVALVNQWREDFGRLAGYSDDLSHLEPVLHIGKTPREEAELTIQAFTYALIDTLAENINNDLEHADRLATRVRKRIKLEQPERPTPAPSGNSIFRECITLMKLVLGGESVNSL